MRHSPSIGRLASSRSTGTLGLWRSDGVLELTHPVDDPHDLDAPAAFAIEHEVSSNGKQTEARCDTGPDRSQP